jgi:hypothetical protein
MPVFSVIFPGVQSLNLAARSSFVKRVSGRLYSIAAILAFM